MPELESLLLVLLIVYGTECLVWVRLGGVAFSAWRGRKYRRREPGILAGNQRGGLVAAHPLPPLGFLFIARQFPVSLSGQGVFSFTASAIQGGRRPLQPSVYSSFESIKAIHADGKNVLIDGKLLVKASSTIEASRVAGFVKKLANLDPAKRMAAIRETVASMFDTAAIEAQLDKYYAPAALMRRLGSALLFFLFLIGPAVIWRFGFRASAWPLVAALFLQTIAISILFHRAHKGLLPSGNEERFVALVLMLLAPASAIRAHDFLARHLLVEFHPLAVAKVLCPTEEFAKFARQIILDLRHPMYPVTVTDDPAACATERSFREVTLQAAEQLLRRSGIRPESITAEPNTLEPGAQSYCPRCGTQFVTASGYCTDCGGRPTLPIAG